MPLHGPWRRAHASASARTTRGSAEARRGAQAARERSPDVSFTKEEGVVVVVPSFPYARASVQPRSRVAPGGSSTCLACRVRWGRPWVWRHSGVTSWPWTRPARDSPERPVLGRCVVYTSSPRAGLDCIATARRWPGLVSPRLGPVAVAEGSASARAACGARLARDRLQSEPPTEGWVCQEWHSMNSPQIAGTFAPGTAELAALRRAARCTPPAGSVEEADAVARLDAREADEAAQGLLRRRERLWADRARQLRGW